MTLLEADAAKYSGMRRSYERANPAWRLLMARLVEETARDLREFTSDDVFDRLDKVRGAPVTHDNRAFGPIMRQAVLFRKCRKANKAPINSRRPDQHRRPLTVWESLLK